MIAKLLMFISSYSPLFALLAVRFDDLVLRWSCVGLVAVGVFSLYLILKLDKRAEPGPHRIVTAKKAGTEASAYLAGYLLPFLTVSDPAVSDLVAYGGFLVVAAIVHVRTGIIQVNPLLFCFGWTVLSFVDDKNMSGYLLTKKRVLHDDVVWATSLSDDVFVHRASGAP
jgi:hypothetical protein